MKDTFAALPMSLLAILIACLESAHDAAVTARYSAEALENDWKDYAADKATRLEAACLKALVGTRTRGAGRALRAARAEGLFAGADAPRTASEAAERLRAAFDATLAAAADSVA